VSYGRTSARTTNTRLIVEHLRAHPRCVPRRAHEIGSIMVAHASLAARALRNPDQADGVPIRDLHDGQLGCAMAMYTAAAPAAVMIAAVTQPTMVASHRLR
jgi:hypothetical protein